MKKKFWIIGGAIVVVLIVAVSLLSKGSKTKYETESVKHQDLRQEVSVTGKVEPAYNFSIALRTYWLK
jgi:multidrug efflux pump subunit AcrA (membrane-fusion protein)